MKKVLSVLLALCLIIGAVPMFASAGGNDAGLKDTGELGEDIYWSLMTDGYFTISNYGSEPDYVPNYISGAPWSKYASEIRTVSIGEGVLNIPGNGFNRCDKLENLYLKEGIIDPGRQNFIGCTSLKTIHYSGSESDPVFAEFRENFAIMCECPNEVEYHYNCDGGDYISPPPTPSTGFTDVKSTDYFADAVKWAVENNITAGKGNNLFKPNDKCTRGEIVTFLWRSAGSPEPRTAVNPFKDVKEKDYYYKAVLWAVENDITAGKGAGTFKPGDKCSRAEAMTFMWRAAGEPAPNGSGSFKDVVSGSFYEKAVGWAVAKGITAGKGTGTFKPNDKCSRAEIVSFLYRGRDL